MKKYEYYLIGILLTIYSTNKYVSLISCILISAILIKNIRNEEFEHLYISLFLFEPIMVLPFVGGSFYRIFQFMFFIKVLLDIKDNKAKIKLNLLGAISGLILIITSTFYDDINGFISMIINVLILLYIFYKKGKSDDYYQKLLYSIGVNAFFMTLYGFTNGRTINYGKFSRFSTTISDPNYSALFINLGIFSILGNKAFSKKEKMLFLTSLFISLLLTVSLTGICGCIMLLILSCYFNGIKKVMKVLFVLLIGIIVFIALPIKPGNILYGFKTRITQAMIVKDKNQITSGRTELTRKYLEYYSTLPTSQILLGGNNTINEKSEIRQRLVTEFKNVSHNSYIDMLYMIGAIPTILLLITYIYTLFSVRKNINFLLMKIVILYFAMTISIFPFRYFYIFYLLNIVNDKGEKNENSLDSQYNISISGRTIENRK